MEITVLVRDDHNDPALWLESNYNADGDRVYTLNDASTSIPFAPRTEDLNMAVPEWKRATL